MFKHVAAVLAALALSATAQTQVVDANANANSNVFGGGTAVSNAGAVAQATQTNQYYNPYPYGPYCQYPYHCTWATQACCFYWSG
jgi:hypothetical protein